MNSFTLRAIGNLSRNPGLVVRDDVTYACFSLVGNDIEAKDDDGLSREVVTSLWFIAYGSVGEEIVANARKGDQLFVEAIVQTMMGSSSAYDHTFIVKGFRFGARKGSPGLPTTQAGNQPPIAPSPSAEEAIARSAQPKARSSS